MTTLFGVGNIAEPVKALLAQFDIDVKALSAQFDSRTAAAMGHRNADAVSVTLAPPPPEQASPIVRVRFRASMRRSELLLKPPASLMAQMMRPCSSESRSCEADGFFPMQH